MKMYQTAIAGASLFAALALIILVLLFAEIGSSGWNALGPEARTLALIGGAGGVVSLLAALHSFGRALQGVRVRRDLRLARIAAEQASRAKTDFLASMSHEIRTPLNSIIGYSELLLDAALTADQRRYVERIHFAGSALLTIVNDVLDFSKVEAGRLEVETHPFLLKAMIDNTFSIVQGAADNKGLTLGLKLDPSTPEVLAGDEARIRQVLLNLLNNAVKFTRQGEVALTVTTTWLADSVRLLFVVRDTGIGIPDNARGSIFERFSQVGSAKNTPAGGTGLGLAVSKRLVELMNGEIGFDSEFGKGSTFWFEIPLAISDHASLHDTAEMHSGPVLRGRLLLVEDLEQNRDLAKKILTDAGHEVDIATNGAEAVAAVQSKAFDLVLMDVQMPVMDGVTAARKIRGLDHPAATVPILAMSANVLPQQVRLYKEAGMNDHIGKPFKRAELLRILNNWLAKRGAPGESGDAVNSGSLDRQVFAAMDEVCQTMGRDWVVRELEKLHEEITDFSSFSPDGPRVEIALRAHNLISHAGMLGFSALSDASRELQQACTAGQPIAANLQSVVECGGSAAQQADEWIRSSAESLKIAG